MVDCSVTGMKFVRPSGGTWPNPAQRYWKREKPASNSSLLVTGDDQVACVTL
jgi:hypothetical protein